MTGYGFVQNENPQFTINVEVKSLNSKTADISLRGLPRQFSDKEIELRNTLTNTLTRGKISVSIEFAEKGDEKPKAKVNQVLFSSYYKDLQEAAVLVGSTSADLFSHALQMPKAVDIEQKNANDDCEWSMINEVVIEAINACDDHRQTEGQVLAEKLTEYIQTIRTNLAQIVVLDAGRIEKIRERIQKHLNEYLNADTIDQSRFEQELIYYIEKLDITEEKVRLDNHLNYFDEMLNGSDSNGKKLGFISQEIGREINTIGSKANDFEVQRLVVAMKDELEKIKEQSLNVL